MLMLRGDPMRKKKNFIQIMLVFSILMLISLRGIAFADNGDKSTALSITLEQFSAKLLKTHIR